MCAAFWDEEVKAFSSSKNVDWRT